jgi:hypothetical protein
MNIDLLLRNCRSLLAGMGAELTGRAAALTAAMKRDTPRRPAAARPVHHHNPALVQDFRRRGPGHQYPR